MLNAIRSLAKSRLQDAVLTLGLGIGATTLNALTTERVRTLTAR
jgi:hypothetical protein